MKVLTLTLAFFVSLIFSSTSYAIASLRSDERHNQKLFEAP